MLIPIEELMHYKKDDVIMDEEHLIIARRRQGLNRGQDIHGGSLLVYTF